MSPTNAKTQQVSNETTDHICLPLTATKTDWLKGLIRDVPDFPKPGIVFKDLTTLMRDAEAFRFVVDVMAERFRQAQPDYIAAIEARGFIFGSVIAHRLGIGFVPIRKPGKLPHTVETESYDLEYGTDSVEIHRDAIDTGKSVVLVDDLLATGGTALAAYKLLTRLGANVVGIGFVVELGFLGGRKKLPQGIDVISLFSYD